MKKKISSKPETKFLLIWMNSQFPPELLSVKQMDPIKMRCVHSEVCISGKRFPQESLMQALKTGSMCMAGWIEREILTRLDVLQLLTPTEEARWSRKATDVLRVAIINALIDPPSLFGGSASVCAGFMPSGRLLFRRRSGPWRSLHLLAAVTLRPHFNPLQPPTAKFMFWQLHQISQQGHK